MVFQFAVGCNDVRQLSNNYSSDWINSTQIILLLRNAHPCVFFKLTRCIIHVIGYTFNYLPTSFGPKGRIVNVCFQVKLS